MKVIPKYQVRTGLPQVDIKVISSKLPLTTTESHAGQKEGGEKEKKVGGDSITLSSTSGDSNTSTALTLLHGEGRPSNLLGHENQTVGNKQYKIITADTDEDLEEEGRAHIKPHEDKVQLEMEQVIRAEMQEPTGVSLGVPYQQYESEGQTNNKKYLIKPLNIDYKPLVNEENIMLMGENWNKPAQPTESTSPLVNGENVYMLPQNIEEQEKLWARLTSSRYPDMSRALFANPLPSQRRARPLQAIIASDRFILLPRP